MLSALTHLGCLVSHSKDRTAYLPNGLPDRDNVTRINNRVVAGSPRTNFPMREDMSLQIARIIRKVLQVPRRTEEPVKMVRYPQEEGDIKATLLSARIDWIMNQLKQSKTVANNLAQEELANFFRPEELNLQDPLGSLNEVNLYSL